MRKVFLVVPSLTCGGGERSTVNLAENLAKRGHEVVVYTYDSQNLDFYVLPPSVRRIHAGNRHGKGLRTLLNWRNTQKLRQVIRSEKPDLVLGISFVPGLLAVVSTLWLDCPVIVAVRNNPARVRVDLISRTLRWALYRRSDVVVAQTTELAEWVEGNWGANVAVIPNFIRWPIPRYHPIVSPACYLKSTRKTILAAGRFMEQKGFDLLLKAFSKLSQSYSDFDLCILGEGHLGASLSNDVETLGISGRVFFPGKVGNIEDWYRCATIFVLSSRFEGFPNVLLEALASGCACVSTNCETGPSELIQHEQNGLLVQADSVDALANGLERLMTDGSLRIKLAQNAPNVLSRYSEERVMQSWLSLFD